MLDLNEKTTWQAAFDRFTAAEQSCVREAVDSAALAEGLASPIISDETFTAERPWEKPILRCVAPQVVRSLVADFMIVALEADIASEGTLGITAVTEDEKSCLREVVANAPLDVLIESDTHSDAPAVAGRMLSCLPDLMVATLLAASQVTVSEDERDCLREWATTIEWSGLIEADFEAPQVLRFYGDTFDGAFRCVPRLFTAFMFLDTGFVLDDLTEAENECLDEWVRGLDLGELLGSIDPDAEDLSALRGSMSGMFVCVPQLVVAPMLEEIGLEWASLGEAESACLRHWSKGVEWDGLFEDALWDDEIDPEVLVRLMGEVVNCIPDSFLSGLLSEGGGKKLEELSESEAACLRTWASDTDWADFFSGALGVGVDEKLAVEFLAGAFQCVPDLELTVPGPLPEQLEKEVSDDSTAGRGGTEPFRIGVMEAVSGPAETYGTVMVQARQLAVDEINAAGGIDGRMLELVVEDSKCNALDAIATYTSLTDVHGVKVILGTTCSGALLGVAALAERDSVVIFSASASNPDIAEAGGYIFRTAMSDTQLGIDTGNVLWADGIRKLATFTEYTAYATGVRRDTVAQFQTRGGEVVAEDRYASDETDFKSRLTNLLAANPDAVHIAAQTEFVGGTIVKQLRELGYDGPLYSEVVPVGATALEIAGEAATGLKAVIADIDPRNSKAQEVLANFRKRYGYVALAYYLNSAYDGVYITAECLKRTNDDQDADGLRDCLYDITWAGALGDGYSFDDRGEVTGVYHMVVEVLPLSERTEYNLGYEVLGPAPTPDFATTPAEAEPGSERAALYNATDGPNWFSTTLDG